MPRISALDRIARRPWPRAPEGDRPARLVHLDDVVLPFASGSARKAIGRAGHERERSPVEGAVGAPATEPHLRRGTQREAEHMLVDRPVAMPADVGIIPGQPTEGKIKPRDFR